MEKRNQIKAYLEKLPLKLLLLVLLFIASIILFGLIAHEVLAEKENNIDWMVADYVQAHWFSDRMTSFMLVITFFGSNSFLLPAYIALALWFLFIKKNMRRVIDVAVIGIIGYLIMYFMKIFFHRVRPVNSLIGPIEDFSFPSGHASSGFIFYGFLAWIVLHSEIKTFYKYLLASMLVLFSLLIGFSRIYLRVHYFTDVVGGFCVGYAWLAMSLWVLHKIGNKNRRLDTA